MKENNHNNICSNCFKNEGLRIEAEKYGDFNNLKCANCGSIAGKKLTNSDLCDIVSVFFERGSTIYEACVFEPILMCPSMPNVRDEFNFDDQLAEDWKLICDNSNVSLALNAPKTYRVGATSLAMDVWELSKDGALNDGLRKELDKVIEACEKLVLKPGDKIYRIRCNIEEWKDVNEEFDTTPIHKITENRLNDKSFPVFYSAYDIETCVNEVRPDINDHMILATYLVEKEMQIINLQKVDSHSPYEFEWEGNVSYFLASIFNGKDHKLTRLLGKHIFERGFDGVNFNSYFSKVRNGFFSNLAIFGYPVKDGKLKVSSLNKLLIDEVKYNYVLGPSKW